MKNCKISVIMSTLNTPEKYLYESINSILNQTFKDFEFIIIIDGGTDDVFIKKNFNDRRIKIIKHKISQGLPKSLNEAIEISSGKYIARMDSDDVSLPKRLEIQYNYMEKNKNIDMCATYYKTIGNIKKTVREVFCKNDYIKSKLFFTNCIAHPTVFFRKSSITEKNLYYNSNYIYSQDFELWNRNPSFSIEIIPKICFLYRIHNQQISSQKAEKQNELYYSVLERNLKVLEMNEENLEYILLLNGRRKSKNYKAVYNFILNSISKNNKITYYNPKVFTAVLKRQYIIYCIKNRCIFNKYFFINLKFLRCYKWI